MVVFMLRRSDRSRDVVATGIFPFPFEFGVRGGDGSVVLVDAVVTELPRSGGA